MRETDRQTEAERQKDSEREGGRKGVRLTGRRRQTEGQIKPERQTYR